MPVIARLQLPLLVFKGDPCVMQFHVLLFKRLLKHMLFAFDVIGAIARYFGKIGKLFSLFSKS